MCFFGGILRLLENFWVMRMSVFTNSCLPYLVVRWHAHCMVRLLDFQHDQAPVTHPWLWPQSSVIGDRIAPGQYEVSKTSERAKWLAWGHTTAKRSEAWIQAVTFLGWKGLTVEELSEIGGRMRPGPLAWEDVGLASHGSFPKHKVSASSLFPWAFFACLGLRYSVLHKEAFHGRVELCFH